MTLIVPGQTVRYRAYDLMSGTFLADLPLKGVKFGQRLNVAGTYGGTLPLDDPRITNLHPLTATQPSRTALYVDLDGELVWGGIIWTRQYSRSSHALTLGGNEFVSYLDHRVQAQDYCLDPTTRVLTTDLRYVPISRLVVGDTLVGFDEERRGYQGRRWRTATVESKRQLRRPCYRLTLEDGREVTASAEHRWLVTRRRGGNDWVQTESLATGDGIVSLGQPWEMEDTRDAGWLAGMYDGEGWCGRGSVGIAQLPGPTLDDLLRALKERGFIVGHHQAKANRVEQLLIKGGMTEHLRLLATIRPERLVAKADRLWEGVRARTANGAAAARLRKTEYLGERDVVALQTSTGTFVAEGLLSHNSTTWATPADAMVIAKQIIEDALAVPFSALAGMAVNLDYQEATNPGNYVAVSYPITQLQTVGQIIQTLSQMGYGVGFDYGIDVAYVGGVPTPTMTLSYPRRGYIYDDGAAVLDTQPAYEYTYPEDGTKQANKVYVTASQGSGTSDTAVDDPSSLAAGYPLLEEVANFPSVNTGDELSALASGELATHTRPPVSPVVDVNPFGDFALGNFQCGDDVRWIIPKQVTVPPTSDERFPGGTDGQF